MGRGALVVGFGVGAGVVVLLLLLLLVLLVVKRREAKRRRTSPAAEAGLQEFGYRELKRATGGFSEANKLGQGGFGSVFRGTLKGGRLVAVKRLDTASLQGEREFHNELSMVRRIMTAGGHDPNCKVVELLGFCDAQQRKLLVYEYMEKRSLQEALFFGHGSGSGGSGRGSGKVVLEWGKRVGILLDVARALAFLHSKCEPPIIHGDVKPSNVLLDAALGAKLADFGLARLKAASPEGQQQQQQQQVDSLSGELQQHSQGHIAVKIESPPSQSHSVLQSPRGEAAASSAKLEDDDDWMSKASGSKLSPSEVDWRSEMSFDSGGGGSKRISSFWKNRKAASPSEEDSRGGLKGYILDWVSSDRGRCRTREWPWSSSSVTATGTATPDGTISSTASKRKSKPDGTSKVKKKQARSGSLEWWAECEDIGADSGELMRKLKSQQQQRAKESFSRESSREWWRLAAAAGGTTAAAAAASDESFTFHHSGEIPPNTAYHSGELSASNAIYHSGDLLADGRRRVRTRSRDWWSGEMQRGGAMSWWNHEQQQQQQQNKRPRQAWSSKSQEWDATTVSSTPSMRGTICYVAPESAATEKSDVYSFGVLCLVVVSGRRPLQVVAAPTSVFERANLVAWTRAAARAGRPLDIVDPLLLPGSSSGFDEAAAAGIVSLALQCLQRSPHLRPSMSGVARVLAGEAAPPPLPLEFSPSPPLKKSKPKKAAAPSRSIPQPAEMQQLEGGSTP